jgi:hypothetical protein
MLVSSGHVTIISNLFQSRLFCYHACCNIGLRIAELLNKDDFKNVKDEFNIFKTALGYGAYPGLYLNHKLLLYLINKLNIFEQQMLL